MVAIFHSAEELRAAAGCEAGPTDWITVRVEGAKMGVNYGTNKVRFPAAVKVGARIRGRAQVLEATDVPGGVQIVVRVTIEIEGGERPACVADTISRFFF